MASNKFLQTEFVETGYGKNYVKLLQLKREGSLHTIRELEVSTTLTLNNQRDYLEGDNSDIIATDSQKNTVYILAKQHGINSPEQFAEIICQHFLSKYRHVVKARVYIEEAPWKRIEVNGRKHVHAFLTSDEGKRFCEYEQNRGGNPTLSAGLKGLRVLKTTQSAFKNFVDDEYRTLPDAEDRLFCTVVQIQWWYNTLRNTDFNRIWSLVKQIVLDTFAGPADTGEYSPSVQNTLYLTERCILSNVPQVEKIEMVLPNVHYFNVDFSRFPKLSFEGSKFDVFMPTDKPSGNIAACIQRTRTSKL